MSTWPEFLTSSSIVVDPRSGEEYQFDGWSDGHANLINKEGKVERWTYYDVKKSLHRKTENLELTFNGHRYHIKNGSTYKKKIGDGPGHKEVTVVDIDGLGDTIYYRTQEYMKPCFMPNLCRSMDFVQQYQVPFEILKTRSDQDSDENPSPLKTHVTGSLFGIPTGKPSLFNTSEISLSAITPSPPPTEMTKEQLKTQSVNEWIKHCYPAFKECKDKIDMVTDFWYEKDDDTEYSVKQEEIIDKMREIWEDMDTFFKETLDPYKEKHFKN